MDTIISISTVAYEGYDFETALAEISRLGGTYVELGFVAGVSEGFTENDFSAAYGRKLKTMLERFGLKTVALAAHMDLGGQDAVAAFRRRMEFAGAVGARIIHTKASGRSSKTRFLHNIGILAGIAESLGLTIALENPGHGFGEDNLIHSGVSGASLVKEIGSDVVRLNYDFGNAFSYSRGSIRPEEDFEATLPHAVHFHLKDMAPINGGWVFTEIGKGVIDYRKILRFLSQQKQSPLLAIELPLMLIRDEGFNPQRRQTPLALPEIEKILKNSLAYVEKALKGSGE